MTTYNTDYSNNELLDQELTTAELSQVSAGTSRDGYGEIVCETPVDQPAIVITPIVWSDRLNPSKDIIDLDPNLPMITEGKNL